eukprot:404779_1
MSTTDTSAHDTTQHHKSRSTQAICKLELQQLTISPIDNHCINIGSGSATSSSSSSPTYTLSTPVTPPSPRLAITPTLFTTHCTKPDSPKQATTTARSITPRPKSSRIRSKSTTKRTNKAAKSCKKYQHNTKRSHKIPYKPSWKHTSRSNEPHTKKKKKKKKQTKKPNIPKLQRHQTVTKVKPHKNKAKNKANTKGKRKRHKQKQQSNAKKHLKLQTSYSERSRVTTHQKKNYYYYSNPNDLFNEKPMSRRPSHYTRQIQTEKLKKKKGKKCAKKKKKKIHKNDLKPRRKRPRPLSSRLSDKKASKKDELKGKMNAMDDGCDADEMQYVNYACSPVDNIEHDLEEMLGVLKQNREQDVDRVPLLSLSHSLSDRIEPKRTRNALNKRSKSKSRKNVTSKQKLAPKKHVSKSHKKKNNKTKKETKPSLKRHKSKTDSQKAKKKPSLKRHKSNKSRCKKAKSTKRIVERIHADSYHSKNAKSMEITLSYSDIARGLPRSAPMLPSTPTFFTKYSGDKLPRNSPHIPRVSKSQHTTPTSPFYPSTPLPTLHIDMHKKPTKGTNGLRRNTIALGKKKKIHLDTSSISLGALSHYFQYRTNHETKSILAQLAGIIMELVGEPNAFNLHFEVLPQVEMAIRRNKLRISPILRRGLVLSFAMHSVPKPLQDEYDFEDYGYISPLVEHTPNAFPCSDVHDEPTPPPRDLPESDLGLTSTDDDEDDNDDDNTRSMNGTTDEKTWVSDGYDTSHFIDSPTASTPTASPPMRSNKSTIKSMNGNTLTPKSIMDEPIPFYPLTQSHTKSTNTPNLSPDIANKSDSNLKSKHIPMRSNSDIFRYESATDFDNVELLRNDKKHLYNLSNGSTSFSSFSIDSHITYNDEPSTSYNHDPTHDKFKSFGSDMTILSNISNTTIKDEVVTPEREDDDGMVYFDDKDRETEPLKLEQNLRTPFSNSSATRSPMFDIDMPDSNPDVPSFGYSSSTNTTAGGSAKSKASISMGDLDIYACDLGISVKNVRVPSPDHPMCMGMKSRLSAKKILLNQTETSNTGDDSECIPYCNYDEDENDGNTNGNPHITKEQLEHLQLSIRSSTYSIPGIGTIQVTTPGNQHTHTIFDKVKECKMNGDDDLVMIEDVEEEAEEETEEEDVKDEDEIFENIEFPYYQWKNMECNEEKKEDIAQDVVCTRRRRMPALTRKNSNSRNSNSSQEEPRPQSNKSKSSNRRRRRCMMAMTPKHAAKPALKLSGKGKKGKHQPKSQTCTGFNDRFLDELHHTQGTCAPDLYQSIVFENGAFRSRNISMISSGETQNVNGDENVIKFSKAFNKMVADDAGNIFIGTDKYIRYITYNANNKGKFEYFRKQEKLLYKLNSDEHLVSLWNQNGRIYFVTMPYALQDIHREYDKKLTRQWKLNLFVVENKNNLRQRSINKYDWIPPSVNDILPYRKLRTFRWRVKGRFIENFLSIWYDEKYETLITLAECDRLNEPQIIFLNKRNDGGLLKLKIRNNTFSIYGSDDSHGGSEDGVDNHLLIRHKPTKSWLCCVSCVDCNDEASRDKEEECWIQFKLNRENNCITSSKIIKLPPDLRNKKWLAYDKHRDCLIGINRLNIEQLLGLNAQTKKNSIQLIVVPRLTKLIQNHATNQIHNKTKPRKHY